MERRAIDRLKYGLPPLVAGLLLFAGGWSANPPQVELRPPHILSVGPGEAEVVVLAGNAPTPFPELPGRWEMSTANSLELRRDGWPSKKARIELTPGVTALRLPSPRATLSITVKGDDSAEVSMTSLPKKTEVPTVQGQARLEAGPHELLISAEGYLPQRLSVELIPGEVKKLALSLEAIPTFPFGLPSGMESLDFPVPPIPPPVAPAYPPRSQWTPPPVAPPPVYQPRPQPLPRFTPVAPAPRVGTPDPQPMFTPVRPY